MVAKNLEIIVNGVSLGPAKEYALFLLHRLGYEVALTEKAEEISPKLCPFCKGENLRASRDGILNLEHIECNDCGMSGPHVVGKEKAIKHWNNIKFLWNMEK